MLLNRHRDRTYKMTSTAASKYQLMEDETIPHRLQIVAWEITRSCNLLCAHCRASSTHDAYKGELSTQECFQLIDDILGVGKPVIILTGGEPLMRHDILDICKYAVGYGLRVVMGSNGTLLTEEMAKKLKDVPISRIGISIDFPTPELQDRFRGKSGAFEATMTGVAAAKNAGIQVQINSTITRLNSPYLNDLLNLALDIEAVAFHPFMLVPTGRGKGLESAEMSPEEYEQTLQWVYDKQIELGDRISFKPTDAPHYARVIKQRNKGGNPKHGGRQHGMDSITRGCLAGTHFCFVSHQGSVQGCGYLDVEAGNIKNKRFSEIWADSPVFIKLRNLSNIKGKCGVCEYKRACGGCRARAYETTGDYLESEPYCIYRPALLP